MLLGEGLHGGGVEAGVGEHADLGGDVGPVVGGAELLEVLLKQRAHGDDAVRHALDLAQPLLFQRRVVQDLRRYPRAVDGRVRVQRPHEDLDLGVNSLLLLGRVGQDREGAHTLAVEALLQVERALAVTISKLLVMNGSSGSTHHVLGEALA